MSGINNRLLTIIIPTYNRREEVRKNLEHTIPLVQEYQDRVSIYVSDNASTDGTGEMVREYVEKYPDIVSYYCQPENITASPNFNHAVHAVESEYCYILGDDDRIFAGFLPTVLCLIRKYSEVDLFHFNYILGGSEGSKCKLQYDNLSSGEISVFTNGRDFVFEFLDGPSFVSSNLFKRQLWIDGCSSIKEDCYGYVWYSILLFGALPYSCLYYSQPMLIQYFPSTVSYSKFFPLYHFCGLGRLFSFFTTSQKDIYTRWCVKLKNSWQDSLIVLTDVVRHKSYYREHKSEMYPYLCNNFFRLYYILLIYIIPRCSTKILKYIIRGTKVFRKI